jgi:hypothetical protein
MTSYATMAKVFVGFVATMAVCHFGVQALDKATAKQCATHDWPQAAHQIHMDIRQSGWLGANPSPVIASCGDRHRTHGVIHG